MIFFFAFVLYLLLLPNLTSDKVTLLFLISAVPLLTYLLTKSDLQMEEATLGSVIIFRTGVEVVR